MATWQESKVLLMLPEDPMKENPKAREFFSFSDRQKHEIFLPEIQGKWCLGSSYGWLFTVDFSSGYISLLNPISRAQVSLPPLSSFTDPPDLPKEHRERNVAYIDRATITADPSNNTSYIVMVIFTDKRVLSFCRPGDTKWTSLTKQGDHFEDVTCHMGKFYGIANWGKLISWDYCDAQAPVKTLILCPSEEEHTFRRYLVDCPSGELWKVNREMEWEDSDDELELESYYHTLGFSVFKLDKEKETWIRLETMGGNALFLGYNRAICLSPLECPEFEANCIYFTDDYFEGFHENRLGCYDLGMYRFTETDPDRKFSKLYNMLSTPFTEPCIWVTPT